MAFFKMKVGDTTYEIGRITLGQSQILKHKFGVPDVSEMSVGDPDVLVGLFSFAIQKLDPSKSLDQAIAEAKEIGLDDMVIADDEKEVAGDVEAAPLAPVADAPAAVAAVAPDPSGSPETTPETPGTPN